MSTFEVEGRTLHYLAAGSGRPLMFVHGSDGSARQWRHHCQHVDRTRRVMAYDLIGCGANRPVPIPPEFGATRQAEAKLFSYEDAAALLAAVEHVGAPADVVAHSVGGVGAILAALARPAAIRTLTLFEPVLFSLLGDVHHPAFDGILSLASSCGQLLDRFSGPACA